MTNKTFQKIVKQRIEHINKVLAIKQKEYATDEDRLHNFKRAGRVLDITPIEALLGMWVKHLVSILDLLDKLSLSEQIPYAMFNEKLGDSINYEILLDALLQELYYE